MSLSLTRGFNALGKARPEAMASLVAIGILLGLGLYFFFNGELNADEGFYLLASRLVRDGLRPYRDFGFTQGPVLPYANLPWLELFGYTLDGQRLGSLAWLTLTVVAGVRWLHRYGSWAATLLFAAALVGSPAWVAYAVKGKTYAFAGLWVLLGTCALLDENRVRRCWTAFVAAAGLAIGARLPTAGFFVPAGVCFLAFSPRWTWRAAAVGMAVLTAAGELYLCTAGNGENFVFWTMQFHHDVQFRFALSARVRDTLAFAPGIWAAAFVALLWCWRRRRLRAVAALGCLFGAVAINLSAVSTFAEYATPFLPALALVASLAVAEWRKSDQNKGWTLFVLLMLPAGWLFPPPVTPGILTQASEAAGFLHDSLLPRAPVVASMAEVAVAAGMTVNPLLAMGKYGVTEEFSEEVARGRRLATPATILELVSDDRTKAVVFSRYSDWNFSTSVPSYRPISREAQLSVRTRILRDYSLAFMNDTYLIYLRNGVADPR